MESIETLVFGIIVGFILAVIVVLLIYAFATMDVKKDKIKDTTSKQLEDVVVPKVFALFEQKLANVVTLDRYVNREAWNKAVIDLETYFSTIVIRAENAETMIERMILAVKPLCVALLALSDNTDDKLLVYNWFTFVSNWRDNASK